jgi:phage terminase large subunit GpA-like protein
MSELALALNDVCGSWAAMLPPNRVPVAQGAAENLVIKRPGGAVGNWNPDETPYMVEPMNTLAMRRYSAVCFVGPAQTGKTVGLGEGWMTHAVLNDPGDMLIVQMTQDKAREYSKQRIDRAIRNSPNLKAARSILSRDDNLHDKQFKNGMWLRIAWPTVSNLSSTSYRYVFGTDYDRWPDDLDGEGDGFTLMGKRITTFLSRGKVAVESSPGRPVTNPSWTPSTPHEAPPVTGILGIYNRSDRRRYYWACPHCQERFQSEPGLGLFRMPSDDDLLEDIRRLDIDKFARQFARVPCPHCGGIIRPEQREDMNRGGVWLADGLTMDALGRVSGNARTSPIAGFWMGGAAATYVSWETLIRKHCQALLEYELTGSELQLQTTANTDQGVPYLSRLLAAAAKAEDAAYFDDTLERYVVPDWTRFVVAAVDVQGGKNARFEVEVHAIGEDQEQALVNRFAITKSRRPGIGDEFAPLDPASHPEDWDVLNDAVVQATYRTPIEGKEIRTKLTLVDSGGEEGVTGQAYAWYRRIRKLGLHQRVQLTKGASTKVEWHIRETMVGGEQGHGDIPLHLLDPNKFKDLVSAGLQRKARGPGFYHFPRPQSLENPDGWLPESFFDELYSESRNENGVWEQHKKRNESFDLCYMIRAGCMQLKADKRDFWTHPPTWALPLEKNSDVISSEVRRAEKLALPQSVLENRKVWERQVRRSSYLG